MPHDLPTLGDFARQLHKYMQWYLLDQLTPRRNKNTEENHPELRGACLSKVVCNAPRPDYKLHHYLLAGLA